MSRNLRSIIVRMHVRDVPAATGRTRRAVFSGLESDMVSDITNELPLLFQALAAVTQHEDNTRKGFPYTLGRFFLS